MIGLNLTVWAYQMGTNRDAYHKLRDLIRGRFSDASDISWATLKDMKYLDAVIKETIRTLGKFSFFLDLFELGGPSVQPGWSFFIL